MKKYLLTILLKTFAINLAITLLLLTILLIMDPVDNANLHFNATGMIYGGGVALNLVLTLLSSTIFLNTIKGIKERKMLSFLSFIILPLIASVILIVLSLPVSNFRFWYPCAITIPYLIIVIYQFRSFK